MSSADRPVSTARSVSSLSQRTEDRLTRSLPLKVRFCWRDSKKAQQLCQGAAKTTGKTVACRGLCAVTATRGYGAGLIEAIIGLWDTAWVTTQCNLLIADRWPPCTMSLLE